MAKQKLSDIIKKALSQYYGKPVRDYSPDVWARLEYGCCGDDSYATAEQDVTIYFEDGTSARHDGSFYYLIVDLEVDLDG